MPNSKDIIPSSEAYNKDQLISNLYSLINSANQWIDIEKQFDGLHQVSLAVSNSFDDNCYLKNVNITLSFPKESVLSLYDLVNTREDAFNKILSLNHSEELFKIPFTANYKEYEEYNPIRKSLGSDATFFDTEGLIDIVSDLNDYLPYTFYSTSDHLEITTCMNTILGKSSVALLTPIAVNDDLEVINYTISYDLYSSEYLKSDTISGELYRS